MSTQQDVSDVPVDEASAPTALEERRRWRAARSRGPVALPVRIIEDAKRGDTRSIDAIYRAYHVPLIRFLRTLAPHIADDVASQTWVSVIQSLPRFSGDGTALRGWILTIGRRRMIDELRKGGRTPLPTEDLPEDAVEMPQRGPEWAQHMLRLLPPRQADVLMLRVIGGLSVDETAAVLDLSPGNVRVLSHRGLSRLDQLLRTHREQLEELSELPLSC